MKYDVMLLYTHRLAVVVQSVASVDLVKYKMKVERLVYVAYVFK